MNTPDGRFQVTESVPDFVRDIRRSQVLDDVRCDEVEARVAAGELAGDARAVATILVHDGTLTEYQARRILVGRIHGLVVGRYTILDRLGSGGMGQVYKAKHAMMGRTVALKFLANRYSQDKGRLARFRREMQLVGLLDHPNIVRAFDADQYGDVPYIVMEFVPGQTLDAHLRARGKLSVPEVLWFGSQVARGLDHAHKQGVIHRDIKPSNILFSRERQVKLLDLGLGAFLEREPSDDFKTEAGATVGTMDYLSPEQACMKPLDGRSDIYSLGCTLYHLMTGRLPFEGESSMERMAVRIIGRSVPIVQVMPELPESVTSAMDRMLARDPADRYQTAGELAAALTTLVRPKAGEAPARAAEAGTSVTSPAANGVGAPPPGSPPSRPMSQSVPTAPPSDVDLTPSLPSAPARSATTSRPMSAPVPASSVGSGGRGPSIGRRLGPWPRRLGLTGLAVLLAAGGIGYLSTRPGSPPPVGTEGPGIGSPSPATTIPPPPSPVPATPAPSPLEETIQAGRWDVVAATLVPEVAAEPNNLALVHRSAVALMMAGDTDACRHLGAEKFAVVANQDNPGAVDIVRACCLVPGNLPDVKWPVELTRKAALGDPKAAWRFYILGLTLFRAGQDAEAIRRLDESIRLDPYWAGSPLNWPVLSLAHRRLGHVAEAQTWLAKARDLKTLTKAETPLTVDPPWFDRAEFEILLREAESASH